MTKIVEMGPDDLQESIMSEGMCAACGACVNLCPYIDMVKDRAVIIESCGLKEGNCFEFCPRAYIDMPLLDKTIFGSYRKDLTLGSNITVIKARAMDSEIRAAAQYGGATSALMAYGLETGEIDAAVLVKSTDGISPKSTVARNKQEVLECAGSKYIVCPAVAEMVEIIKQGDEKIGIVGTSCQITAIRKMEVSNFETCAEKLGLIIGLFCTWAISPDAYKYIRELVGSDTIVKFDIPPPPANILVIYTPTKTIEVSLDELRKYILPSCNTCFDMTNEFADISVGTVEGQEDWNTVIIRTEKGEKFMKSAIDAGIIETESLEEEKLNHLCEASLNRKKKVLSEMDTMKKSHLIIREEDRLKLMK